MRQQRSQLAVTTFAFVLAGLSDCWSQTLNLSSTSASTVQQLVEHGDVNLEHSRVYIKVGKVGLGHEHGVIGKLRSGSLKLDGEAPKGTLVFDMSSFDADTPAARKFVGLEGTTDESTRKQVNNNMRGPELPQGQKNADLFGG